MSNESLTYTDLADRLGTTQEAARSLARRLRLPRMKGNDGKARVNLDLNDFQYKPMPTRKRDGHLADTVEALMFSRTDRSLKTPSTGRSAGT